MKVLVTGGTGLLGRQICLKLIERGDELVVVSTKPEQKFRQDFSYPCEYVHWDHLQATPDVDAVIHLAGDNIASGRWTAAKKKSILESRTEPTQKLVEALARRQKKPKVFISTSAIGFYGDRGHEILSEDSKAGQGFLADVCKAWEGAASGIKAHSRLVVLRVGIVLDVKGGFLARMEPLFSANLGGKAGSGKQWMSWIHSADLINMFLHCLDNDSVRGTYNAVAPSPVTNSHFTKAYARQLGVMSLFAAPALGLKLGLGEMSQLALASQNVLSKKIQQTGFAFQFETIEQALKDLYSWKKKANQQLFFSEQWISQPKDKVFPFFSEARNLEKITPPFLNFRILKSSMDPIAQGALIDYRLKIHGVPARWRTEIQAWKPNEMFVDSQLKGPYSHWHHTHFFRDLKGGTLMQDRVIYELPLGKLGLIVAGFFVRKDVESIFGYRTQVIHQLDGSFQ